MLTTWSTGSISIKDGIKNNTVLPGEPTGAAPSGPAGPHGSAPSGTVGGANQYGSREPVRFARELVRRLAREPVRLADRMACLDRTGWLRQPYRTGSANQYRFSPTVPVGHIRTLAIHAPTLPSKFSRFRKNGVYRTAASFSKTDCRNMPISSAGFLNFEENCTQSKFQQPCFLKSTSEMSAFPALAFYRYVF